MEKMERDLRDMMQRQAGAAGRAPTATRALVRRAQLRRAATGGLAGALVLILVVGGIAASRSLVVEQSLPPADTHPENGKIIVQGADGDLFQVDPDGSGMREFLRGNRSFTDYKWSSDGSRMAFLYGFHGGGLEAGKWSLYVVDADGGGMRRVVRCPGRGTCDVAAGGGISWSPDGTQIALSGEGSVYVVNVDTGNLQRLPDTPALGAEAPMWSPDGSWIAFVRAPDHRDVPADQAGMYVMRPDGSDLTMLAHVPGARDPAWSPDGTRIVFSGREGVYVVGVDGSNLQHLVEQGVAAATWSPDGTRIVYSLSPRTQGGYLAEVWAVETDGGERSLLYRSDCCASDAVVPVWSPDGHHIVFNVAIDRSLITSLAAFIMDADGTNLRRVVAGSVSGTPAWQPIPRN